MMKKIITLGQTSSKFVPRLNLLMYLLLYIIYIKGIYMIILQTLYRKKIYLK